jgi:hypothetical protein
LYFYYQREGETPPDFSLYIMKNLSWKEIYQREEMAEILNLDRVHTRHDFKLLEPEKVYEVWQTVTMKNYFTHRIIRVITPKLRYYCHFSYKILCPKVKFEMQNNAMSNLFAFREISEQCKIFRTK